MVIVGERIYHMARHRELRWALLVARERTREHAALAQIGLDGVAQFIAGQLYRLRRLLGVALNATRTRRRFIKGIALRHIVEEHIWLGSVKSGGNLLRLVRNAFDQNVVYGNRWLRCALRWPVDLSGQWV